MGRVLRDAWGGPGKLDIKFDHGIPSYMANLDVQRATAEEWNEADGMEIPTPTRCYHGYLPLALLYRCSQALNTRIENSSSCGIGSIRAFGS